MQQYCRELGVLWKVRDVVNGCTVNGWRAASAAAAAVPTLTKHASNQLKLEIGAQSASSARYKTIHPMTKIYQHSVRLDFALVF